MSRTSDGIAVKGGFLSKRVRSSSHSQSLPLHRFRKNLLSWFHREQRDLPWRRTRDPYRIWVSEIMLQQTQVAMVIPYYRNFLRQFPSLRQLAEAPLSKVFAAWAGLGYYSRARNLHRAAKTIVKKHRGVFPRDYNAVHALPGIGRYTAGAILSIAFGQPYAVVDGNVERVLGRVLALRGDLKSSPFQKKLWALAEELLPKKAPSDFNQGMMELGATVCLPREPECARCPVQRLCEAHRRNIENEIPRPRRMPPTRKISRLAAVLRDDRNRFLLVQRRNEKLMRDFWEFPQFAMAEEGSEQNHSSANPASRLQQKLRQRFGMSFKVEKQLCRFQHSITFRRIELHAFLVQVGHPCPPPFHENTPHRWVPRRSLEKYLFDSASLKILAAL